jgi:BlaI family transcriptional regulator, penicillinase repressor
MIQLRLSLKIRELSFMNTRPSLSKSEIDVVRVLWEIGPAGVREIHEKLAGSRDIDFTTVQTYLRRLEAKGYATSKINGRTKIYSAKTKPGTVIRETVNDLVDRLFGGQTMPLLRHLLEERGLNAKEVQELKELLNNIKVKKR